MAKEEKKDDVRTKNIKTAQDRKDYSIAFFNSTNSAIEVAKMSLAVSETQDPEKVKETIIFWREFFLAEHSDYRERVTEKIGATYNPGTVIERMEATKNKEELQKVWLSLTEDERRDNEIHAKCREMVAKHSTVNV